MKKLDLAGIRFGKLVAIKQGPNRIFSTQTLSTWECDCDCGGTTVVVTCKLRGGRTKSCGCIKKNQKPNLRHGNCTDGKVSKEYWAWHNAKRRCTEVNNVHWHRYGGRGITMCAEWIDSFAAFIAHIGPRPAGHTLDRIDNDKGYYPGNVRWATPSQQAFNRDNKQLQKTIRERKAARQ